MNPLHLSRPSHRILADSARGLIYLTLVFVIGSAWTSAGWSEIVINEIMYHPSSDEENGEYLELYNSSPASVDLSGWQFTGGIDFVFPPGTVMAGDSYLLLCRNELFIRQAYPSDASVISIGNYAPSRLSNSGEDLELSDAAGNRVDRVSYSDRAPWASSADGDGASLELVHPLPDNNNALYWNASRVPTPGRPNSRLLPSAPPRIEAVFRFPQAPTASDTVTVTARFAADDDPDAVTLTYRVNQGEAETVAMSGPGREYSATIPAQTLGAVVHYWITAENASGYPVIAPSGTFEQFYLYQVVDEAVPAGAVVINEIMYNNPNDRDEDREWVELFNPGAQALDVSYWVLQDANEHHGFRLPAGTVISPQGYLIVARVGNPAWQPPVVDGLSFPLGDEGDEIRLLDQNRRLIAAVEYDAGGAFPAGADGTGNSLELLQASRPNEESNNWAVSLPGGTPGAANSRAIGDPGYHDFDVVINEIFYHPEDEEYDDNVQLEYIELFNRNEQPVDLSGWYFADGVEFAFPVGTILAGKGYLLVTKNRDRYPEVADRIGNFNLRLSNGGEVLALSNHRGVIIDYVPYNDDFPFPALPDGRGNSLELIAPGGDNRVAQVWRSGQPNSPGRMNSNVRANTPPRITDVAHSPQFPTATRVEDVVETTELVKVGKTWRFFRGQSQPPSDWNAAAFDDSAWDSGPSGIGYGDGDDATVLDDMINNYFSLYMRTSFNLEELPEDASLTLYMDYDDSFIAYLNGTEVARANQSGNPPAYNDPADGNREAGTTESFDISAYRHLLREGENVLAIQGHNVVLDSSDFSLIPALEMQTVKTIGDEDSADTIIITAQVRDGDGIEAVTLQYQLCLSPSGIGLVLGDWQSAPMRDDGSDGDAVPGDGVYSYRLNDAGKISPHQVWRYRILARDLAGEEAVLPLPSEETRNFALFVENANEQPRYPTTYLFMERTYLNFLNNNPDSDDEQPCLVVIDGEVFDLYYGGGARFRGNVLRDKPQKSWKIQFAKGHRWRNQRTINLNSNYQTSPLVRGEAGFLEFLAYEVFRQAGVPTPDTQHRRLVLNDEYYGLFLQVEQYNEDFLENHNLPEETVIYKAGVKARPSYMTNEPDFEAYADKYENSMGREEDIAELIAFIEAMNSAEDVQAFFETHLDVDLYLDYLACLAILSHVDATEKNYFPTRFADGRWAVLPWDISHAWGEMFDINSFPFKQDYSLLDGAEGGKFGTNRMRQLFLRVPEYRERYYQRLRDLSHSLFTREHLDPLLDAYWAYLADAVHENVERWDAEGQVDRLVAEMKSYVTRRREFILSDPQVVPENLPPQPVNWFPADGDPIAGRSVTLSATGEVGELLAAVQWELQVGSADFADPLWRAVVLDPAWKSIDVPASVIASDATYFWRVRWQENAGDAWSEWSEATSFVTTSELPVPEVEQVVVVEMDQSIRLQWELPTAPDLLRVDIYEGEILIESTPINDNRVRIQELVNGVPYTFTLRMVTHDRRMSPGVTVTATPRAPLPENAVIAYFRFEESLADETGIFTGELLGEAEISPPGGENPVQLTQAPNLMSLQLPGGANGGFRFGSTQAELDAGQKLTIECYARLEGELPGAAVLVDRYLETSADDAVWRFGLGLSAPGSIDFFLNDADTNSTFNGRLHAAASGGAVPQDGQFHHYAAVIDLTENLASRKIRLYLDGIELPVQLIHDDGSSPYRRFRDNSDLPIYVGARRTVQGTTEVLPGRIDEVRLSQGALSTDQFLHPTEVVPILDWALY